MKKFIALWLVLIVANLSGAQAQNRPGAFAAAAAPGQVPAPPAVTPQLTTPPAPGIPRPATPGQPGPQQQQEQLRVVADPATNSLIIYGTVQEYQNVKNILKELDAIPRQVLIEAMILQVSYREGETFGIDYEIIGKSASFSGQTFASRGALFSGALASFLKDGGAAGIVGGGNNVNAFVTALLKDSRVKLLSSPSVLATDNRPARIQVGTEEPVPTGTVSTPGDIGISASTTVQYRNTGRILTIIPQVNSQGLVNLQVKAEVSQRGESVSFGGGSSAQTATTYPTFETQDAETNAVVQDGETLVIGGLIGERKSKDRKGIPYLMDIPVVGRFFGTTIDDSTRTELIMLITPRVIRNRDESRQVTADFKAGLEKVRAELERVAQDRARLLPPRPLPPLPDPNQYYQYDQQQEPAPTNPPVGPRTSLPPVVENVTVLSNDPITRRMLPPMAVPQESNPVSLAQTQHAATQSYNQPIQSTAPVLPAPPAYIMSFTPAPPVPAPAAPAVPVTPAKLQKSAADPRRIWTVQVAAVAESRAAESLAQKLRQLGYEAYVRVTQSENKIWHRVRVGQLESQKDAADLRNILSAKKEHKDAYIALY